MAQMIFRRNVLSVGMGDVHAIRGDARRVAGNSAG